MRLESVDRLRRKRMVGIHWNLHLETSGPRVGEMQLERRVNWHEQIWTVDATHSDVERDRAEGREVSGTVEGTELPVDFVEEVVVADGEEERRVVLFDAQPDLRPCGLEGLGAQGTTYAGDGVDAASADFGA